MLPAKAEGHARDETLPQFASGHNFGSPDDEVVQQHHADDGEDHAEVEAANPAHSLAANIGGEWRVHMNLGRREFLGDSGMALSAGAGKIRAIDGRSRIARRKDAVRAVATGAVGDDLGASAGGEAVIAGEISGLAPAFDTEFLRQAHAFMATGAGDLSYVLC